MKRVHLFFIIPRLFATRLKHRILLYVPPHLIRPLLIPVYQAPDWPQAIQRCLEAIAASHKAVASFDHWEERNREPTEFILNLREMLRQFVKDFAAASFEYGRIYPLVVKRIPATERQLLNRTLTVRARDVAASLEDAKLNLEKLKDHAIRNGVWENPIITDFHTVFDKMKDFTVSEATYIHD